MARSTELTGAASLLGTVAGLAAAAPGLKADLLQMMTSMLSRGHEPITMAVAGELSRLSLTWILHLLAPMLLGGALAAIVANVAQVGFLLSSYPLRWDPARLSPVEGLKRLVSVTALVQSFKSMLKILVVALVAGLTIRGQLGEILQLGTMLPAAGGATALRLGLQLALRCTFALLVLGLVDYAYQRQQFEKTLRMTRQEIRDEMRESEGDPHVAAQRRRRRREMLEGMISREMSEASVVLTNPTHLAVALRYSPGMAAPRVVAKGKAALAQRIIQYARHYGITVQENKPLARAIYRQVKVGQPIPPGLYQAVAQVLAVILRRREELRKRRRPGGGKG